mmetsp:Transcript_11077/g.15357  ORF Transcript_11077/g.15357 Transcript_11077/m.15357 type:complete len:86 (+) Transcript_11077:2347-2604(+)
MTPGLRPPCNMPSFLTDAVLPGLDLIVMLNASATLDKKQHIVKKSNAVLCVTFASFLCLVRVNIANIDFVKTVVKRKSTTTRDSQ